MGPGFALAMAGAASAHQAATASREQNSQQRADRTRRTSKDPQRAQQGASAAAAAAPAALNTLSRLKQLADASPQVAQLRRLQALTDGATAPAIHLEKIETSRPNGTGLPENLKTGIEALSGMTMGDVRVHYNSDKPAQLQALAYAQGTDIHIAPGQEKHLPHEAWHVVQQKQGRVQATKQMKDAIQINDNTGLEKEADVMGAKALQPPDKFLARVAQSAPLSNSRQPIQAKLGFEIEMLVLVDDNGRPVPEKEELGAYGAHCQLVVDHGPSIATNTPETPEAAEFDLAMEGGYKRWWHHIATHAMFASRADADAAHPGGGLEELYFNASTNDTQQKAVNPLDWQARWRHTASGAVYMTEALALAAHPAPEVIEKYYHQHSTGNDQDAHPFRAELGTDHYASIIEIVTSAYAPETPAGKANIIQSMVDARNLANAINAADPRANRFKLNTVAPGISDRYYIGNPAQPRQTVDGSIQSNFGIELSEIAAFVEKTINGNQGGLIAGRGKPNYKVKHHTDVIDASHDEGDVVKAELVNAAANANTIINAIPNPGAVPLPHLKGLMIIVCQYLRFGKIFYSNGYDLSGYPQQPGLVKNMIPLMARTDMARMFNELVPAAEQGVINVARHAVLANILLVTGRAAGKALLNDPGEQTNTNALAAWGPIYSIGCDDFVSNVFTQANDGVTAALGNVRQMPPEKIDGSQWTRHQPGALLPDYYAHPGLPNQPGRPAAYREGAVFELRNMVPPASGTGGVDRFIPDNWPWLARYFCGFLELQHVGPPPVPAVMAPPPMALPPPPPPIVAPPPAQQGNGGSCCFITTACVQSRGLPDDCEELTVLRGFRDHYMRSLENGEALIGVYYEIAPKIVRAIDSLPYSNKVYEGLYLIISECVKSVKEGQYDRALLLYKLMLLDLVKQYLGVGIAPDRLEPNFNGP
jgi:hypothetical protein